MDEVTITSHLSRFKESFLYAAARGGRISECESLLELGADPNLTHNQSQHGDTPFLAAARNGHVGVVMLLLSHGADLSAASQNGDTALNLAVRRGDDELCAVLKRELQDPGYAVHRMISSQDGSHKTSSNNKVGLSPDRRLNENEDSTSSFDDLEEEEETEWEINGQNCVGGESIHSDEFDSDVSSINSDTELDDESSDSYTYRETNNNSTFSSSPFRDDSFSDMRISDGVISSPSREQQQRPASSSKQEEAMTTEELCRTLQRENKSLREEIESLRGHGLAEKSSSQLDELEKTLRNSLRIVNEEKEKLSKRLLEEEEGKRVCVVCRVESKSVLLMPCRHLCVCQTCSARKELETCPLCRVTISERIRVFA